MKYNKNKGFTLTELMTVVVILSVLMGIAVGSYRKAAEESVFEEGLVAAHAVLAGVERYHDEHPAVTKPTIAQADVEFTSAVTACSTASDYCTKTRYFEVTINDGSVQAQRSNGKYTITVYPDSFGVSRGAADNCRQSDGQTKFCVAKGYITCNSDTPPVCTKPM